MDAAVISEATASLDPEPTPSQPDGIGSNEADNKFQRAISAWRGINLASLIQQLDTTASDIIAHQRDALVERKDVAQKTKDFRKLDDAGKLSEYKTLLKSYQAFIDLLTTHGKESTSAFLQLYTPLSDAPDPFPLLEASVEAVVTAEDTVPKLRKENDGLQRRVSRLSAQLDEAETTLEKERTARKDAEDGSGTRLQEIEDRWVKVLEEKESNWKAKEQALDERVENQDRLLRELKASYEVSQRLGQESANAGPDRAAAAELEMTSAELDKTSARLAEIEARNEQLRVELARLSAQNTTPAVEDDPAFLRIRTENSSLLRKLESVRYEKDAERREWENKRRHSDRHSSNLSSENLDLRAKIEKWSDYNEMKRELDMMKALELSTGDDDFDQPANGSIEDTKKDSLEQVLLARNKKLSNDLTLLRVSHQDLEAQLSKLQEELSRTTANLDKSHALAATLENDLSRVQQEATIYEPSIAGRTYTSRLPPPSSRRGRASPTSSIISGYENQRPLGMTTLEQLRSGEPQGGGSGILPMVQAQRDRFKQKNVQLEEELSKTYATVTALRAEVASLQKDNLGLYEKSRYVSAYSRTAASGTATSAMPSHTSVMTSDPEDKYHSKYESQFHETPFSNFKASESVRAYNTLSMPERVVFTLTRMILGSRWSRNAFAGYCVGLHLLVLGMLYGMVMQHSGADAGIAQAMGVGGSGVLRNQKGKEWQ